ncbi:MAG: hypothetical protein KDC87_09215 [Planctomycetes bacterium]|nr:hypothetical protein [Planctomycetota bacterium]MCB9870683.1 hypothetical protein [Planctomycetota bacterium]
MKLFQRLKIWKELKRLEAKVHENPSPSTYVDLGQVYLNMEMTDHTVRVADEGLSLFPNSEELRKLRKFAQKAQLNAKIKDLRVRLNKSASPKIYKELADQYLELGDFGAVQGIAEECIRRFPEDAGAYFVLAKARLTNFYRDMSSRDGLDAVRGLQRVVDLERKNTKALKMLAEVLIRVGALDDANEYLQRAKKLMPSDRETESLLREAQNGKRMQGSIDSMFHHVEERGTMVNASIAADKPQPRVAAEEAIGTVRDYLAQLVEVDGVIKACYIKGSKAMVKGDIRDGNDGFLRVVRVVAKAAQRVSRRMDIGNFSKASIDGEFGHICVCSFGDVVAALQCEFGTPVDRLLADLQELVAGSLYMSRGAER